MTDKKKKPSTEDEILAGLDELEKEQESSASAGAITAKISDDKLKASVSVPPPMDTAETVDKAAVISKLVEAGVKFGIDEDAIDEIFQYGSYNVDVVVAKGKAPTDGASAKMDFKFDISGNKKLNIQEDAQGNVDHRESNAVESVEQGAVLAVKIPPVPGENGMTVTGVELPASDGRDIELPLGENVEASEDGLQIIAAMDGQPVYRDKKISVSPVYEIKGDVNYSTGNINFNGSVMIRGNVQSDFVISASDDVEIHGNIEKAFVEAGGDVRILGGIYGASEGKIKAGGSITIRTVESGILEAGENITITQSSRYSILEAGENIILQNTKGSIVGGKATAGRNFLVTNIGSPSFTETVIEVGINPKIKEKHDQIEKNLTDEKVQLDKVIRSVQTIKSIQAQGKGIPPDKQELLKKLIPAAHKLKADIESNTKKLAFLQEKMKQLQAGRCKVGNTIYPGVRIFTLGASMTIQKEINHSSFYEQNEQIQIGPY
jgi:hypothetical protein